MTALDPDSERRFRQWGLTNGCSLSTLSKSAQRRLTRRMMEREFRALPELVPQPKVRSTKPKGPPKSVRPDDEGSNPAPVERGEVGARGGNSAGPKPRSRAFGLADFALIYAASAAPELL